MQPTNHYACIVRVASHVAAADVTLYIYVAQMTRFHLQLIHKYCDV